MSNFEIYTIRILKNKKGLTKILSRIKSYHREAILLKGIPFCLLPVPYWHFVIPEYQDGEKDDRCRTCALETLCPGFPKQRLVHFSPQPISLWPQEVVIEITHHCNLNCVFCHTPPKKNDHMDPHQIKRLVDQAKRTNVQAIRFTGGEPTLHPAIDELCEYTSSARMPLIINSNGTNPNIVKLAHKYPVLQNILFSLNPSNPSQTKTVIQIAKACRRYCKTVRLGSVITPALLKHLEDISKLVKKVSPTVWELYRPLPPAQDLSPSEWEELISLVTKLNRNSFNIKIANHIPLCWLNWKVKEISMGNFADHGHTRLVYRRRPKEGFYPDYHSNLLLGKDIASAWNHPVLTSRRLLEDIKDECKTCQYRFVCKGKRKDEYQK